MKIDMNPHAITSRIKKTSELRRLCIALGGERLKKKLHENQTGSSHSSGLQSRLAEPNPAYTKQKT